MGKYLNRPTAVHQGSGSAPLSPSGEFPILYPALFEFLTLSQWEDGISRQLGSLTLFVDPPLWKCCLRDRDGGRVAFVSGSSAEEVLSLAEGGIVASTLDWRGDRPSNGKKR